MTFGEKFKAERRRMGLTQQEVADGLQDAYWEAKARNAKKHAPGKLEDADA